MKKPFPLLLLLTAAGAAAIAYFIPAAFRPLGIPDEFRYAVIPRAMLESGDWITPRLLGQLYFEKPVFGYWMIAASQAIFGITAFALRLPMVLATFLAALGFAHMVRRHTREEVFSSLTLGFYLGGSVLIYFLGVCAVLDSLLTLFTTLLSITVFAGVTTRNVRHKYLYLIFAGFFAGLAFLTKGPIGLVLPALGIGAFLVWSGRWKYFWQIPALLIIPALITVLPWSLAIHRADSDFWNYFIIVEHFQRFAEQKSGQHAEVWWYFLALFPVVFLPGLLGAIPCALRLKLRDYREMLSDDLVKFCICSVVLPVAFLSCSSGKLITYILPAAGFFTILEAQVIYECYRMYPDWVKKLASFWIIFAKFVLIIGGVGAIFLCAWGKSRYGFRLPGLEEFLFFTGLAAALGAALLQMSAKKTIRFRLAVFALALALPAAAAQALLPHNLSDNKFPEKDLEILLSQLPAQENIRFATNRRFMHAVSYVSGVDQITLIGTPGEMWYSHGRLTDAGEKSFCIPYSDCPALLKECRENGTALVVIFRQKDADDFNFGTPADRELSSGQLRMLIFTGENKL